MSPAVSLSAATLNFGTQTVGSVSPTPQAVTLTNTGNAALSITGIAIGGTDAGDFSLTAQSPCGASVAPGGTCSIQVNFTPGSSGARSATLSISDNASGTPQTVALSGTGSDFKLSASPPSATVHQGGSTSYTLTVTPLSGFTGTVSLACNGAPGDGSCNLSLPSATFTANSSPVSVTVNVGTTAPGAAPGRPRTTPPGRPRTVPVLLGLLLAALLALRLARGWRWRAATLAAAALLIAVLAASCGNTVKTRPASGTPFGTYTLTLTGSSSNLGHSTSVTLIVN